MSLGGVPEVYHQYSLSLVPGVGDRVTLATVLPGKVFTE